MLPVSDGPAFCAPETPPSSLGTRRRARGSKRRLPVGHQESRPHLPGPRHHRPDPDRLPFPHFSQLAGACARRPSVRVLLPQAQGSMIDHHVLRKGRTTGREIEIEIVARFSTCCGTPFCALTTRRHVSLFGLERLRELRLRRHRRQVLISHRQRGRLVLCLHFLCDTQGEVAGVAVFGGRGVPGATAHLLLGLHS